MEEIFKLYRKTLVTLHHCILNSFFMMQFVEGGTKLGIYSNKKFNFKSQLEQDVFFDFNIYEKINGKERTIDKFCKSYVEKTELEKKLLEGMLKATTSLYLVKHMTPENNQIMLEDLVSQGQRIPLTDIHLSHSIHLKQILFARIIDVEGIYMTSGMALPFDFTHKVKLLKEWNKKSFLEPDEVHRFINLFHLYRKYGYTLIMNGV